MWLNMLRSSIAQERRRCSLLTLRSTRASSLAKRCSSCFPKKRVLASSFSRLDLAQIRHSRMTQCQIRGRSIFIILLIEPNKAPAPNRRPRFPLGGLGEFEYRVCAPPPSPAAVGEAVIGHSREHHQTTEEFAIFCLAVRRHPIVCWHPVVV